MNTLVPILTKLLIFTLLVTLLVSAGIMIYFTGINPEPVLIQPDDQLSDVKIQPSQALELAQSHLAEHGTYRWRNKDRPLKTYIVRQKTWFSDGYYIRRHNYPAKTYRYHMNRAVKVHTQTGEVTWEAPQPD